MSEHLYKNLNNELTKISPIVNYDNVFDNKGESLQDKFNRLNHIFLEYINNSVAATRLQIPLERRRKGLYITYVGKEGIPVTESYAGDNCDDASFVLNKNWSRLDIKLDNNGKILSQYLPSYVDDVLEYDSLKDFPEKGDKGKIYVTTDTDLTYRWSGSKYTEISKSLALGGTETTAFWGNRGVALEANLDKVKEDIEGINENVCKLLKQVNGLVFYGGNITEEQRLQNLEKLNLIQEGANKGFYATLYDVDLKSFATIAIKENNRAAVVQETYSAVFGSTGVQVSANNAPTYNLLTGEKNPAGASPMKLPIRNIINSRGQLEFHYTEVFIGNYFHSTIYQEDWIINRKDINNRVIQATCLDKDYPIVITDNTKESMGFYFKGSKKDILFRIAEDNTLIADISDNTSGNKLLNSIHLKEGQGIEVDQELLPESTNAVSNKVVAENYLQVITTYNPDEYEISKNIDLKKISTVNNSIKFSYGDDSILYWRKSGGTIVCEIGTKRNGVLYLGSLLSSLMIKAGKTQTDVKFLTELNNYYRGNELYGLYETTHSDYRILTVEEYDNLLSIIEDQQIHSLDKD